MKTTKIFLSTILSASFMLAFNVPAQAKDDNRDVVHDARGQVIKNSFGNCVRIRWSSGGDECGIKSPEPEVAKTVHTQIPDEQRTVYFEFNKTTLMASEQSKLGTLANTLKEMNDISGVSIVGYADRIGTEKYNEELSKHRAESVEKYLRTHGYLNTSVAKTRWLGESTPITECADTLSRGEQILCLQKDRRVTVEVKYKDEITTK